MIVGQEGKETYEIVLKKCQLERIETRKFISDILVIFSVHMMRSSSIYILTHTIK